jgi:hypothetical protein
MSARREIDGWYVARSGSEWTIGRRLRGRYCAVTIGSRTLTFGSKAIAEKYLRALLLPTGVEHDSAIRQHVTIAEARP